MTLDEAQGFVGLMVASSSSYQPMTEIVKVGEHAVHVRFPGDCEVRTVHPRNLTDPEDLGAQEKIRFAEALIRREHRVLDDDWMFWGHLADSLNDVAHTPDLIGQTPKDWRRFNNAQTMATGYIRMSNDARKERQPR